MDNYEIAAEQFDGCYHQKASILSCGVDCVIIYWRRNKFSSPCFQHQKELCCHSDDVHNDKRVMYSIVRSITSKLPILNCKIKTSDIIYKLCLKGRGTATKNYLS